MPLSITCCIGCMYILPQRSFLVLYRRALIQDNAGRSKSFTVWITEITEFSVISAIQRVHQRSEIAPELFSDPPFGLLRLLNFFQVVATLLPCCGTSLVTLSTSPSETQWRCLAPVLARPCFRPLRVATCLSTSFTTGQILIGPAFKSPPPN